LLYILEELSKQWTRQVVSETDRPSRSGTCGRSYNDMPRRRRPKFSTIRLNEYDESQLVKCETKESQRWRHASASVAAERITEITKPRLSNDNKLLELEKTFSDFGVQVFLPDPIYEVYIKRIQELEDINQQLLSENATLKKQLDEAFNNQQDHIKSVKEITKRERVIVRFIETLTHNKDEYQNEGEKLFKGAVAVNAIYGSRHLKYVSTINLATSAIKYSVARSKMVINIDNHIISSAFNNEQKGQKNYLDCGYNTVIFNIVMSFEYEKLFSLTSGIINEIHQELTNYLTIILEELCAEKSQETNVIDKLVQHQSQIGSLKKCPVCQLSNIDNKKQVCPACYNKLPTITEMNQLNKSANIAEKPIPHFHTFENAQLYPEIEVYMPQLYVLDPIAINSNSIANIQKVFEHIKELFGIKDGYLEWAQNGTDLTFRLKYEQSFFYLQAIINFYTEVHFNRSSLRLVARQMFAPIWSARCHLIYQLIKLVDKEQWL
ncbi:hypothetical protein G9A89_000835, partial [Geosiphon pyriformis]